MRTPSWVTQASDPRTTGNGVNKGQLSRNDKDVLKDNNSRANPLNERNERTSDRTNIDGLGREQHEEAKQEQNETARKLSWTWLAAVFFVALIAAYGIDPLQRVLDDRWSRATESAPTLPATRTVPHGGSSREPSRSQELPSPATPFAPPTRSPSSNAARPRSPAPRPTPRR